MKLPDNEYIPTASRGGVGHVPSVVHASMIHNDEPFMLPRGTSLFKNLV